MNTIKKSQLDRFQTDSIGTAKAAKVNGGKGNKNYGGGPGNSGPGDKNSQNEKGHGGQPTG